MHKNYLSKLDEQKNEVVDAVNTGKIYSSRPEAEASQIPNWYASDRETVKTGLRCDEDESNNEPEA